MDLRRQSRTVHTVVGVTSTAITLVMSGYRVTDMNTITQAQVSFHSIVENVTRLTVCTQSYVSP